MTEVDLLSDLISSNPNEPARNGTILLLRAETKSEFKAVGRRLDRIDGDLALIKADITGLKGDVAGLKGEVAGLKKTVNSISEQVATLVEQVAILVDRSVR